MRRLSSASLILLAIALLIEQVSAYYSGVMRQIGRTWTVANPAFSNHVLTIESVAGPYGYIP